MDGAERLRSYGATGGQEVGLELQTTHPTSEDQDVEARSH